MSPERQRIVRVAGSRRAQLTPAPGTTGEPDAAPAAARPSQAPSEAAPASGPNDARMHEDVPPHY